MNKTKIFLGAAKRAVKETSPRWLTALGLVGMAGAIVVAVTETPKAVECVKSIKREHAATGEPIKKIEYVRAVGPRYVTTALIFAASAFCILESDSIDRHREINALLMAKICDDTRREYKNKVIETLGEKKEKDICDSIDKDRMTKDPVKEDNVIKTGRGESLCYDPLQGRYFRSSMEEIKASINRLNNRLNNESYISLNDMNEELDLQYTELGEIMGWHVDWGLIEATFSSQVAYNDEPCLVMHLNVRPNQGYSEPEDYITYYNK